MMVSSSTACTWNGTDMLKAHGLRYVRDGQLILSGVDVAVQPGQSLAVHGAET